MAPTPASRRPASRPASTQPAVTRRWFVDFRRAVRRHRRKLAVLATLAAVLTGLTALAPPRPATVEVVTAARPIPGGTVLTAADLDRTDLAPDTVPDGAWTESVDLIGATLAGPVPSGQVLTRTALLRHRATGGAVIAPLRLADQDASALVEAGDAVDVLAVDQQSPKTVVVATNVRVVTGTVADADSGSDTGGLILVEVDRSTARTLAAAAATSALSIVWR
ncbi:MAG: SAF domain-containing protein [Microlunatus sp.]|nr:SAF domain-containing protein [Microlunatus sp.]